jgi:hypothetical protein
LLGEPVEVLGHCRGHRNREPIVSALRGHVTIVDCWPPS